MEQTATVSSCRLLSFIYHSEFSLLIFSSLKLSIDQFFPASPFFNVLLQNGPCFPRFPLPTIRHRHRLPILRRRVHLHLSLCLLRRWIIHGIPSVVSQLYFHFLITIIIIVLSHVKTKLKNTFWFLNL